MKRSLKFLVLGFGLLALVACNSGKVRRVSPPAAAIQQLAVQADGSWEVQLRLNNYSSIPMRFDNVRIQISVDEHPAGTLQGAPGLSIGPTSADVVTLTLKPEAIARMAVADALAGRRSIGYRLEGAVDATPEDAKQRSFDVDNRSALAPAPGLDGVLR